MDDLIDALILPSSSSASSSSDFQADVQYREHRRTQWQRRSGAGNGQRVRDRSVTGVPQFVVHQDYDNRSLVRFSDHQTMAQLHMRPDGSFVRRDCDRLLNVPLEFVSDHLKGDLDADWGLLSLAEDRVADQEMRWLSFLSCLSERDMRSAVGQMQRPVVAESSVIADIMSTPLDSVSWHVFAWKEDGVVYLKAKSEDRVTDSAVDVQKTTELFLNLAYKRLMTKPPDQRLVTMNESDKWMKVSRISLSEHRLVVLSETDARDVDGQDVRLVLHKSSLSSQSLTDLCFNLWAESQVSDCRHVVLASYDEERVVKSITHVPTAAAALLTHAKNQIPVQDKDSVKVWDADRGCHFMHRFLTFVQSFLSDRRLGDQRIVSFQYVKRTTKVITPVLMSSMDSFDA